MRCSVSAAERWKIRHQHSRTRDYLQAQSLGSSSAKPSVENYTYSDRSDTIVKRPSRSKRSSSKKSIKYEDFSDDDFFRSFEEGKPSGAKTSGRSVSHDTEDEQPLTLDDIFGGDKK